MIRLYALFLYFLSLTIVQASDTIVGGLSSKNIDINTTFTGSDILIFGSIKRKNDGEIVKSDIIIEVLGPKLNLTVRKKKKMFGIWINSNPIKIYDSPSFYTLIYTKKPSEILTEQEQKHFKIGTKKFFKSSDSEIDYVDAVNAKIRIRRKSGSYVFNSNSINLKDETLFSARVSLPANLNEGDYETKMYLVQNKKIINYSTDIIKVRKIGLEKWLYKTAHNQPLFYGLFSIFLALFFGWSASTLFRRFQK